MTEAIRRPSSIPRFARFVGQLVDDARFESQSPLRSFGRSRHLSGVTLGLDADGTAMPDLEEFEAMLRTSFAELTDGR